MSLIKQTSSGSNYLKKTSTGADANRVSSLQMYETQLGSEGETTNTVFTIADLYYPGTNTLMVFVEGQKAQLVAAPATKYEYAETDNKTITFGDSLLSSDVAEFIIVGSVVSGSTQVLEKNITEFDIDGTLIGVENANIWNMTPTVRFSPIADGAIWASFRFDPTWNKNSDVLFKLLHTLSTTDTGTISMFANIWVVDEADVPNIASPDLGPLFDSISTSAINSYHVFNTTNIKIAGGTVTNDDTLIILKLWRDIADPASNHTGWLEMIKLIAHQ